MRQRLLLIGILFGGILTSCSSNSVEDLAASVDCGYDTVSFSGNITPILQHSCTDSSLGNCHYEGSENGDFTIYDGIITYVEFGQVKTWVVDNRWMPPTFSLGPKALSECDVKAFKLWIESGAPNN